MRCIYYRDDGEEEGKLGCYKIKKTTAAVDTNKNDEVEMNINSDFDN